MTRMKLQTEERVSTRKEEYIQAGPIEQDLIIFDSRVKLGGLPAFVQECAIAHLPAIRDQRQEMNELAVPRGEGEERGGYMILAL